MHNIEIGPNQPSAVDVTVGFPCVTPGSAKEWHLFGLRIRVYAMDAHIAVSSILQYPIDRRTL
jgi:hypothetical protein